jgi:hypothetical protein
MLLLAVTLSSPAPLPKPILPASFDTAAALALARDLSTQYPDRIPGSAGGIGAASWFSDQLQPYGLTTTTESWVERIPALGRVPLQNLVAVAPGQSKAAVVVMAHRDDIGVGPGANDNASGTAALIELARAYARPLSTAATHVQSSRTVVFLSTDAGAFGGLGAAHFIAAYRGPIVAVINLDAIAGPGRASIEIGGDRPRSPNAALLATTVARLAEQLGQAPRHVGVFGQLVDLGFPYTLYEQGPFVGAGIPAVTITTGGDRPPAAFGDNPAALDSAQLGRIGLASQQLLGSLDPLAEVELASSPGSYVFVGGGRVVKGWAIELVLVALLAPFAVAIVDLYALCRRHRVAFGPPARALRSRLLFWLFALAVFTCFRKLGAWPSGSSRPPDPATPAAGDWPAAALIGLGAILLAGWAIVRVRLVPRRPVAPEEEIAGSVVALAGLLIVALLVVATNPFALLFVIPALHSWLWLPQIRIARAPVRLVLFAVGLVGPAIVVISLGWRYGLGFDAPWYLFELVGVGYIKTLTVAIALAGTAAAAQLATISAGRYAPYPDREQRGPRGPVRELVRALVLGRRARRGAYRSR